jgi:hypothetical protein
MLHGVAVIFAMPFATSNTKNSATLLLSAGGAGIAANQNLDRIDQIA